MSLPDLILPQKRYFGLSIERTSLHGVEVVSGRPVRMSEIQIPDDSFSDGVLTKTDVFVNCLRQLVAAGKFTTPYVAVCFPEVFAYTRGYTLPDIPVEEMQEAVAWHARELFPFPPGDIYFDWKILKRGQKDTQANVVAVQKKILDPLVGSLIKAGLKPLRFEPDASALGRLLKLSTQAIALLIEINPQGAYVTLVEGEKAHFTTVINYDPQDSPESYLASIDQTLSEIASYYRKKGMLAENSAQIIITGQMASDDWTAHISQLLGYPAQLLKTGLSHVGYNKAFAAAVLPIAPPVDPQSINLLPSETQSFYDTERTTLFYRVMLTRMSAVAGILCAFAAGTYVAVTMEKQGVDAQVHRVRSENQLLSGNARSLLLLNAQAKNIVSLSVLRTTPQRHLEALKSIITDNISITSWEYDDSKLLFILHGIAVNRDALLDFKKRLDASENFALVTLPLGTLETPTQVPFEITFVTKN
ncbi:hypothetical protein A2Z33_06660 [Candidatus Gottesmanbacteria bacterium RBG_16_52_11]|uniref:SHS2 domain-containing protein n=1 Tax=Candidatus Gottesmanbacteria bacterium RBG_16_52_11 TaxID=1798374 RepID=A0A1F5YYA4_9BACT|nr:MAG: hypothetical protein A2Z33_06660 [Candidatus Gottesmanbacteria bacterium RBG_16_52_11]